MRPPLACIVALSSLGFSSCLPAGTTKPEPAKLLSEAGTSPDVVAPLTVANNLAPARDAFVSKVVTGVQHACAIRSGALACWGLNKHGQIGNGESGVIEGQPDALTGTGYTARVVLAPYSIFADGVTDVALGYEHTCAIRNGELFCWGSNEYAQLGQPSSAGKIFARPISLMKGAVQVAARGRWTCAVADIQNVRKALCFGTRLVRVGPDLVPKIVSVSPKEIVSAGARAVSMSANHACVIVRNGGESALRCFGMNLYGEVGNGLSDGQDVSALSEVFASGTQAVATAENRSCAVVSGKMKCFGVTLGDRAIDENAGAWRVPSPDPYDSVFWGSLAPGLKISASGTVLASTGDLYYGSYFHADGKPQKIAIGAIGFDYAEGDENGCVMFRNRAVKCWGSNLFGQLGAGVRSPAPVSIFRALDVAF